MVVPATAAYVHELVTTLVQGEVISCTAEETETDSERF